MITTLEKPLNMYNAEYDVIKNIQNLSDLNNKLFCTFTNLEGLDTLIENIKACLLYTSPSPRDRQKSRMPSSA